MQKYCARALDLVSIRVRNPAQFCLDKNEFSQSRGDSKRVFDSGIASTIPREDVERRVQWVAGREVALVRGLQG